MDFHESRRGSCRSVSYLKTRPKISHIYFGHAAGPRCSVSSPKNDLFCIFGVVSEVPFVHLGFVSSPFPFNQIYPAANIWKQSHRNDEDCSWWLRCRQTSDGVRSPEISRDFHSVQEGHCPNYCEETSLSPESPGCEVLSETPLRKLELPATLQAGGCLCHSPKRHISKCICLYQGRSIHE